MFERGTHVSVTLMEFFKPVMEDFFTEIRQNDRRTAKEWDYINYKGLWAEFGQRALEVGKDD